MTEEIKKDRTAEEMWADWARKEITDQAAELKELRRFKREAEKELRRFKKYSTALEKEVKALREALENIKEKAVLKESEASNATYGFAYKIEELAREALKGGEE